MFFGGGDPFEHFANMHGSGGGGGGRSRAPVDNDKLYAVLGVPKDAEESEIRKAYKKLALKNHPDKGGDPDKFKEISAAAEILCDADKRKIYDEQGLEGLEGSGGGEGQSANDIFSMFFGGEGRGGGRRGPQKGEDIVHTIKASLEDMYNGKTVKLAISRNKPCPDCEGRGGKVGAEKTCSDCNGRGVKISLRQIGPGMVQQVQSSCSSCKGAGKSINEKDKCKSCKGTKVFKDRKVLEVNIEKGMSNGQKIKFSGEADEVPGTLPGDVVIVVQEKEHETFKRKGADLLMNIDIQLSEALCGFVKVITHLDERVLKFEIPQGQVIKQDALKIIQGEGMPQHGNIFNKGNLFLHFNVKYPASLPVELVKTIKKVLPTPPGPTLTGEEEVVDLSNADSSQIGKGGGGGRSAHDDDDDDREAGGAQRVQCGQN